MKKFILITILSIFSLGVSAKAEKWIIDTAHSKVGFEISHLVISTVEGNFTDFKGTIMFDAKDPLKSKSFFKIETTIKSNSINTANEKRDKHLRSGDFFDVKKNPLITFTSTNIATTDGKHFIIEGDLTMAGKTKKVKLETKYLGSVDAYDVKRVSFKAKTKVKREDFGLTWNDIVEAGPVVGSEVEIELKIQAKRASDLE
jgi:polyisoprenoid-binding protein YceI